MEFLDKLGTIKLCSIRWWGIPGWNFLTELNTLYSLQSKCQLCGYVGEQCNRVNFGHSLTRFFCTFTDLRISLFPVIRFDKITKYWEDWRAPLFRIWRAPISWTDFLKSLKLRAFVNQPFIGFSSLLQQIQHYLRETIWCETIEKKSGWRNNLFWFGCQAFYVLAMSIGQRLSFASFWISSTFQLINKRCEMKDKWRGGFF